MAIDATIKCSYWIFIQNFISHLKCNYLITILCYFSGSIVSIQRRSIVTVEKPVNSNVTVLHQLKLLHGAEPFCEASRFSGSQEIPRILWNPKIRYRIHKCPNTCPFPEPDQSCPHPTFCRSILILSSHLRLGLHSDLLLSKPCIYLSSPHICYMSRPSHFSWFDNPNNV